MDNTNNIIKKGSHERVRIVEASTEARFSHTLKKKIMRRVYAVWLVKKLTSRLALELIALVACFLWLNSYVSFSHVWANMPSLLDASIVDFIISALKTTEFMSKILLATTITLATLTVMHSTNKHNKELNLFSN